MSDVLFGNDEQGVYPPSYYQASADMLEPFACLMGEETCDVCVIGAGYTGLSSALHLADLGFDVVLVDAHRVGWGASGRNGGQLSSGLRLEQTEVEKLVGPGDAKTLWDMGLEANQLVRSLIGENKIYCELQSGVLHANHRQRFGEHTKREIDHLQNNYGFDDIRFVDTPEIRQLVGSQSYYSGSLDMRAGHLHPLKYALGLARLCVQKGVRIFEQSQVKDIEDGDPAIVSTQKGVIKARHVLIGCNGYLQTLNKKIAQRVMPINNFIIASEPLPDQLASELISQPIAVADSKFVINYFRMSSDNRLLFGGGENYSYKFPDDIKAFVTKPMLEIFPQLKSVKIDYGWGGTLGITMNRMPYIDRLAPNIFTASGYSGEGVGMATFAGKVMAQAVAGTAEKFDIMQAVPTQKFPGGVMSRKPLLALAMLYYSIRDRL